MHHSSPKYRNRLQLMALAVLLAISGTACTGAAPGGTITAAQARDLLSTEPQALLLDVRTQEEFDSGYIEGAKLLPYDAITPETAASLAPDKAQPVIVYCRSGRRSAIAAKALRALGYQNVRDLGGIGNWTFGLEK